MIEFTEGYQFNDGIKEYNFDNCSFKVRIPQIEVFEEYVHISFGIMTNSDSEVAVALDEIYLSDILNRRYDQFYSDVCYLEDYTSDSFSVNVQIKNKDFFVTGSFSFS